MKAEIVIATPDHARAVAERLRIADCQELRKLRGISAETDMLQAIERSTHAWTGLIDGMPICLFGLMAPTLTGNRAIAWLFTTSDVARYRKTFWRGSRAMVATMRALYPRIEGICDARFAATVRWLTRLDFELSREPVMIAGVPFLRFGVKDG